MGEVSGAQPLRPLPEWYGFWLGTNGARLRCGACLRCHCCVMTDYVVACFSLSLLTYRPDLRYSTVFFCRSRIFLCGQREHCQPQRRRDRLWHSLALRCIHGSHRDGRLPFSHAWCALLDAVQRAGRQFTNAKHVIDVYFCTLARRAHRALGPQPATTRAPPDVVVRPVYRGVVSILGHRADLACSRGLG